MCCYGRISTTKCLAKVSRLCVCDLFKHLDKCEFEVERGETSLPVNDFYFLNAFVATSSLQYFFNTLNAYSTYFFMQKQK